MARQEAMATIDAALSSAPVTSSAAASSEGATVPIAPGIDVTSPVTDSVGEKGEKKKSESAVEKEQQKLLKEQERLLAEQEQEEQANSDAFRTSASATVDALKRIATGASVTLGRLPAPGGLIVPLAVLFVFFFLLLPVNGHTRFSWLGLVLSGNARVSATPPGGGTTIGGASGGGIGSGSTSTSDTAPIFSIVFQPGSFMTGVEELI